MLKVKPYKQTAGWSSCGPASLKMVLDFYGVKESEKKLVKICGTTKKHGTRVEGFKKAAKYFGLKILVKDFSDFSDVDFYLRKKIPVIIDWFSVDEGHYSVAVGLDKKHIYLADPEFGKITKTAKEKFKRIWFDFPGDFLKQKNDLIIRRIIAIYK